ncbi:MAG: sulfite exporter TauE/SafE family protein [Bacteroidota bacterium]|jgi:uncharacterized membrane protein YfcA
MIVIGVILFLMIGIILGLIGGGGSILAVPVLVYAFQLSANDATSYSLFIIGISSLIGAIVYLQKGELSIEAILKFALASMITVFLVRKYLLSAIPAYFEAFHYTISKNYLIMLLFSLLTLISSIVMIRNKKPNKTSKIKWDAFYKSPVGLPVIILMGVLVGLINGLLGVGGGFIIVPVIMFSMQLNFKKAIGTSLFIISLNSLIGFSINIPHQYINWFLLLGITSLCIIGIILGHYLSNKISSTRLKPFFGWFTLCVGFFVIIKESFF